MTVEELIKELQKQNPQSKICLGELFDSDNDIKITSMGENEILLFGKREIRKNIDDEMYAMY